MFFAFLLFPLLNFPLLPPATNRETVHGGSKCMEKGTEGRVETYTDELSGCTDIVYITHRDMHACVTLNSACPLTVSVGSKWEKKRWAAQSRLAEKRCLAAQTPDSSR